MPDQKEGACLYKHIPKSLGSLFAERHARRRHAYNRINEQHYQDAEDTLRSILPRDDTVLVLQALLYSRQRRFDKLNRIFERVLESTRTVVLVRDVLLWQTVMSLLNTLIEVRHWELAGFLCSTLKSRLYNKFLDGHKIVMWSEITYMSICFGKGDLEEACRLADNAARYSDQLGYSDLGRWARRYMDDTQRALQAVNR